MKLKGIGLAAMTLVMAFFIGYQLLNPDEKIPKNKKNLTILNGDDDENMETSNSQKRTTTNGFCCATQKQVKFLKELETKN